MIMVFIVLISLITLVLIVISYRVEKKIPSVDTSSEENPLVSIIIPAHNEERTIGNVLKSVLQSDYLKKEIIVMDDSSTDRTAEIVKSFKGVILIRNKKRKGKPNSLNYGFKKSNGDLVMFLDADTILHKSTIKKLVSSYVFYTKNGEKIGYVAPTYNLVNKEKILSKISHFEQVIQLFLIKLQMFFNSILAIRGCCLLVNKQAFIETGGFSNTILEDGDFAAKVRKAGYLMKYEMSANVDTFEPETIMDVYRSRKRYGKGIFFCILNHWRHFLFSRQSIISYYPFPSMVILFIIVSLVISPFSIQTLLSIALTSGAVSFFVTFCVLTATILGKVVKPENIEGSSLFLVFPLYIFIYSPLSMFGYFRGFLSGISDKLREKGELKLKDW